jgi:hypothetical protein
MIVWLRIVAGRRKFNEISEVEMTVRGGALVSTAPPSAESATNASTPAAKTPAPVCHHGLAGIATVAVPRPTSVKRTPERWTNGAAVLASIA